MGAENLEHWLAELASGDDGRAERAVEGLSRFGSRAVDALIPRVSDPQPDARWWALRALAEISDSRVPPLLAAALEDSDPAVQQCAALALRRQPAPEAVPTLISALGKNDRLLTRLAGDALASAGPAAARALIEVLEDRSYAQTARMEAARALALLGDTSAIPALFAALDDDSVWIQYWANEGLERLGVGMTFFKP